MPPKRAKKGAISQTEKAIADTQAAVEEATQSAVREQDPQSDAVDAETQVDADPQSDAGVTSSEHVDSSNANVADGAMASTADDADDADDDAGAATPATEVTTDDEADAEPDAQPKVAHKKGAIAGKKMPATTTKNEDGSEKKIRKKKRKNDPTNFHAYIHKVQKEMYPTLSMSKTAMCIMNDFTNGNLCKKQKKATLQAHDIQRATKLVIGGQLAKHAITEGTKAIRQYNRNTGHNYR
ncbi:histone-fold-containing protein [Aureobasidium pullulans]|uniref:Histone-fold-containing protein n=1 Tax=Aureobasidium pullulans TaxID=5580 RepID=A0A4S8YSE0_AURPU|nr:histone-fold-containing protein [Aureobasidium pullulans]